MANAQKASGIAALDSLLRMTTTALQVDQSAGQKINIHEYIDTYADALGVSPRIILADDKVAEIQAQQKTAMQQQQAVQNIGQISGAAKNLSQADTSNPSLLSSLLEKAKAGQLVQQ